MGLRLPTIIVVDPNRCIQDKWWSIPDLPVTVTLFATSGRSAIERAREFEIDLVVVRCPLYDMSIADLVAAVRRSCAGVRVALIHSAHALLNSDDIAQAAPDFVSSDAIDPSLLSAVLSKLLGNSMRPPVARAAAAVEASEPIPRAKVRPRRRGAPLRPPFPTPG